jgi:hypothetical protein
MHAFIQGWESHADAVRAKLPPEVEKPAKAHAANLKTIIRAAKDGALAVLEVRERATGRTRAALVAINRSAAEFEFVPFALMLDGNPYEQLDPPAPDGGFFPPE